MDRVEEILALSPPCDMDPSRTAAEVMLSGFDMAVQFFELDPPAAAFFFSSMIHACKRELGPEFVDSLATLAQMDPEQKNFEIKARVALAVEAMLSPDRRKDLMNYLDQAQAQKGGV